MFRVLITDDNAGFRKAVSGVLQAHSRVTEFREASSGQETLQQLDSLDLLFLDISLPQENGLQLAAKVKSEHPNLLIGILTIHDAVEYGKRLCNTVPITLYPNELPQNTSCSRAIRHREQGSTRC